MSCNKYDRDEARRFILKPWMIDRPAMACRIETHTPEDDTPEHPEVQGVDAAGCIYQLPTRTGTYQYYLESFAYLPVVDSDADESVAESVCETIHERRVDHERSRVQAKVGEASHLTLSCSIRDRFPKDVDSPSLSDEYIHPPVSPIRRTDIFTTHPSHSRSISDPQPQNWFGTRVHTVGRIVLTTYVEGAIVPRDTPPEEFLIEYATRIEQNAQQLQTESPVEELPLCVTDDELVP